MYHCPVESLSIYFYGTFTQFKSVLLHHKTSILFYHTHVPFCTIALLIHSLTSGVVILLVFLPEFINLTDVVTVFVFLIKFVILIVAGVTLFVFLIEFVINVASVVILFLSDIVVLLVCVR